MERRKSVEEILSREMITQSDIRMLFGIGYKSAKELFDKVQKKAESEGKINIPGRVSWRRLYRMLGLPVPQGTVDKN